MGIKGLFKNVIPVSIRIAHLKRKASKCYLRWVAERDLYSCGLMLGSEINPRISKEASKFNRIMEELAILDPTTPDARL